MKLYTKIIIYTLFCILPLLFTIIMSTYTEGIYIEGISLNNILLIFSIVPLFLGLFFLIRIDYNIEYECKHCKNHFKLKFGEGYIRLSDDILLLECPKCGKIDWCKHKRKS